MNIKTVICLKDDARTIANSNANSRIEVFFTVYFGIEVYIYAVSDPRER